MIILVIGDFKYFLRNLPLVNPLQKPRTLSVVTLEGGNFYNVHGDIKNAIMDHPLASP